MRKKLCCNKLFKWNGGNVPHEWLSPAFISEHEEDKIKEVFNKIGLDRDRFFNFFIFIILSHHNRENQVPNSELINSIINWINYNWEFKLEYYYNVQDILNTYNTSEDKSLWNIFFNYRVRWLGSLMKCDYCASAGIKPEESYNGDYQKDFKEFLDKKNIQLREFQKKVGEENNKSIILIASTGMGKTEAAMNWINGKKAFYLLGIRIAVNEMYKRFQNIFGENVALLHGETSYFFAENETGEDDYDIKIEKARKLSFPLTVATADQLVISVFKYPGFELTYLTCSYSKIVLDEIQSFAPAAIAAIVVFLKEIHRLGGRFMLMTATLPPFILEEFNNIADIDIFKPQLLNIKRHIIATIDQDIGSEKTIDLLNQNRDKKILIICNTVKKAQHIYEFLKDFNPNLIHSRFIGEDRKEKEKAIVEAQDPCVWISTQIVEASLDFDFDLLLTENASIEALLQRFGRCFRKREYNGERPNIFIFKSEPNNIYDKYLFEKTWQIVKIYDNKLLTEQDKQDMINKVFENIESTEYYREYIRQKDLLEIGYRSRSRIEAQEDFRQITNNYVVIPEKIYEENKEEINKLLSFIDKKDNNKLERIKSQSELMNYTLPVQLFGEYTNSLLYISNSDFCKRHNVKILKNTEYSKEKGLIFKSMTNNININIENII
jgi:CRISPR-associated endonuclease/helicase Cas3